MMYKSETRRNIMHKSQESILILLDSMHMDTNFWNFYSKLQAKFEVRIQLAPSTLKFEKLRPLESVLLRLIGYENQRMGNAPKLRNATTAIEVDYRKLTTDYEILIDLRKEKDTRFAEIASRLNIFADLPSRNLLGKNSLLAIFAVLRQEASTRVRVTALKEGKKELLERNAHFQTRAIISSNILCSELYTYCLILDFLSEANHEESVKCLESKSYLRIHKFLVPLITYVIRHAVNVIVKRISASTREEREKSSWRIAIQDSSTEELIDIPGPTRKIAGDPFLVQHVDRQVVFFEEILFGGEYGVISVHDLKNRKTHHNILNSKSHNSFPFTFHEDKTFYMIPEGWRTGSIELYRCLQFPELWEHEATLMSGVSAADTIAFKHQEKWWLFTNIDRAGLGSHNEELHIFYADDLFGGNWKAHAMNPIFIDSRKSRNAGFISGKSGLYRLSQRQDFDKYGQGVTIWKIDLLDPSNYIESMVLALSPKNNMRNTDSFHHLSMAGNLIAFDYIPGSKSGLTPRLSSSELEIIRNL